MSAHEFWTVTDETTNYTNQRSSRFLTLQGATNEATIRIESGRTDGVYILKAVQLMRRRTNPIEIIDL